MKPFPWKEGLRNASELELAELFESLGQELEKRGHIRIGRLMQQDAGLLRKRAGNDAPLLQRSSITDELPSARRAGAGDEGSG